MPECARVPSQELPNSGWGLLMPFALDQPRIFSGSGFSYICRMRTPFKSRTINETTVVVIWR
jgi:hypothetical protein